MIHFSSPNYKSDIFSKNHVSGNARKIGVTFIWWLTIEFLIQQKEERDRTIADKDAFIKNLRETLDMLKLSKHPTPF